MPRGSAGVATSAVGPSGFGPAGSPTRSSTPGAAIPSRGSRSGGGGGFRSWPGTRRRFGGSAGLRASVPFGEERRSLPAQERRSDPGRRSSLGSFKGASRSRVSPEPRSGACGRCGEACLPARARGGRRKVRMLVCPAPRAETRLLDYGAAVPNAVGVVSSGSTPLRGVRGILYRGLSRGRAGHGS